MVTSWSSSRIEKPATPGEIQRQETSRLHRSDGGSRSTIRWTRFSPLSEEGKLSLNNRIQELRQKIREVTGEEPAFGGSTDYPPEIEEAFLESVLAFETAPKRNLFELLTETGMDLPCPTRLIDGELTAKLREVIRALLSKNRSFRP
jgi:hypothetical protein